MSTDFDSSPSNPNAVTLEAETAARFLLGELSEADREALEERALHDEEFFARLMEAESDLADAWARGELPEERARRLESVLGLTPGGRDRMAFAAAFARYLASREERAGEVVPFQARNESRRAGPGWSTLLAVAAALLLAVVSGWLFLERADLEQRLAQAQQQVTGEQAPGRQAPDAAIPGEPLPAPGSTAGDDTLAEQERTLTAARQAAERAAERAEGLDAQLAAAGEEMDQLRRELEEARQEAASSRPGAAASTAASAAPKRVPFVLTFAATVRSLEGPRRLVVPPGSETLGLTVDLGDDSGYGSYRAALRTAGGDEVWSRDGLVESAAEWGAQVQVDVPASLVKDGEYELILLGFEDGASEEIGYYPFRVARR